MVLFSSCATKLNYLGNSFTPTNRVDVYVDASAIKRPYTVVGKGYMQYSYYTRSKVDIMQKKAVETAKSKGADAVLFQEYHIQRDGTSIQTVSRTDSVGKGVVTIGAGMISPIISSGTNILFLKYD